MSKKIDYFEIDRMSNSRLKNYAISAKLGIAEEEKYKENKKNGVINPNFHLGNYFDYLITEPEKAKHVIRKTNTLTGKHFQADAFEAEKNGGFALTQGQYDDFQEMKKQLFKYEKFNKPLFKNGNLQEEIMFDFHGLEYKAKLDYLELKEDGTAIIRDLKTISDITTNQKLYYKVLDFKYHWQAETYITAVSQKYNIPKDNITFDLVFCEKAKPFEIVEFNIGAGLLQRADEEIQKAVEIYKNGEVFRDRVVYEG